MQEETLVTVLVCRYIHETYIPVTKLESEDIPVYVKDDQLAQIQPFYSDAMGGIKIQVSTADVDRALMILREGGFIKESKPEGPPLLTRLDNVTSKIPLLRSMKVESRMLVLFLLLIMITIVLFWIFG
jgi:hypothetical protein